MSLRDDIRNLAIIAHVDHGKTTLVDGLLRQSGIFRANENVAERVMDSNDLERERGITILAKNTAVVYKNIKINIVDTPGHADFSGEVERVLSMVDGVLLVVDAFEGPMPQTKFVLRKALEQKLKPIVVINKIDRPDARVPEVLDEIIDLFIELNANDEQLDFPVVYASARNGTATCDISQPKEDIQDLFETIINSIPKPDGDAESPLQMLVTTLDYSEYLGRIAIGRIGRGTVKNNDTVSIIRHDGKIETGKIGTLYTYIGLKKAQTLQASAGDIVAIAGLSNIQIGETISDQEHPEQLPVLRVDEPTLSMTFHVNDSPFSGQDGIFVTSRHLRERLYRETETNISLKVEDTDSPDALKVSGRGELHLSILIETMRREGYEFQISKPEVIFRIEDGKRLEPYERLVLDVPEEAMGSVMEKIGSRKGIMTSMIHSGMGSIRLEFTISARSLIGFRSEFMTMTKGYGIMNHVFDGYGPDAGETRGRQAGVMIASETGTTTIFALHNLQERGILFVKPGTLVYEGMVVGESNRSGDMEVNVSKKKHVTNMRSSTAEESLRLDSVRLFSLEQCLEYINDDELVEVTPISIRIRKRFLSKHERAKSRKKEE
jgi:GTP-binding protein